MRVLIIVVLIILSTSCSTVKNSPNHYKLNFSKLEAILSSNFNQNSTITIRDIDNCKVEFKSYWSKEVSEKKGFYSVHTVQVIDFTNNYKNALFVPAHDVIESGVLQQRWSDLIEINFLKDIEVRRVSLKNEWSDDFITFYNTDYLSIGVYNPDNKNQINKLLKVFDLMHRSCMSS